MVKIVLVLYATTGFLFAAGVSGEISTNETWSGDVTVTGDVVVTAGTLFIEPGTAVKFTETNTNIVFGEVSKICIAAVNNGYIQAQGAPYNRVTFTTTSVLPAPDAWDGIRVYSRGSVFRQCNFAYGSTFIVNNPPPEDSAAVVSLLVSNCRFEYGALALYSDARAGIRMDSCYISNCGRGVSVDGVTSLDISFTYLLNLSNGIVLSGVSGRDTKVYLNHITMDNIDMMLEPNPKWWTGYGIFCINQPGTVELYNSLLGPATLSVWNTTTWNYTSDYNYYYNLQLTIPLDEFNYGPNDIVKGFGETGDDYREYPAQDGLWRGAEQEGDAWQEWGGTGMEDQRFKIIDFKLPESNSTGLYDINGKRVFKDHTLKGVAPGMYLKVDEKGNLTKRAW